MAFFVRVIPLKIKSPDAGGFYSSIFSFIGKD